MASLLIFFSVHKLLNSSFRGFIDTFKPRNTVTHNARKSNITRGITRKYKIDEIEGQQISRLPPTHNELTPTKISEASVCQRM